MTFYSKPAPYYLTLWISLSLICLGITIIFNESWHFPIPVIMIAVWALIMHHREYKVQNGKLQLSSFSVVSLGSFEMQKLKSVKYRKNSSFTQLFGVPRQTIELYFARDGHMELWNSDPCIYAYFKKQTEGSAASEMFGMNLYHY